MNVAARPLILAHRGLHGSAIDAPKENSYEAFAALLRAPLDGVEFDVRIARDGEPVVIHDASLARTHGDPRAVADLDADELTTLGVPRLAVILQLLPPPLFLDIELKVAPTPLLIEQIRQARGAAGERMVVSSFNPAHLRQVEADAPSWERWLNVEEGDPLAAARAANCQGVAVALPLLSRQLFHEAAFHKIRVAAWTVRAESDVARLGSENLYAVCGEGAGLSMMLSSR